MVCAGVKITHKIKIMPPVRANAKPNLTQDQRDEMVQFMMDRAHNACAEDGSVTRTLPKGLIRMAADKFDVHRNTVANVWNRAKRHFDKNRVMKSHNMMKGNTGTGVKWDREEVKEEIRAKCDTFDLRTLRGISKKTGIPYGSIHTMVRKEHMCVRKTDIVKPFLKDYHWADRFAFAAAQLVAGEMQYCDHSSSVHCDEKWFNLLKKNGKIYMFPEDEVPARFTQNKNRMTKVMFFIAVTRPRYDMAGNCIFDGKIGCWPFAILKPAVRDSPNRPKGTLEWKNYSVKRDQIRDMLFQKVLPAVCDKFSQFPWIRNIDIQWDNASTHFNRDDPFWVLAKNFSIAEWGIDFNLVCQPARSPDFNICDLSICNVLQILQWSYDGQLRNEGDVIAAVNHAWASFTHFQLEKAFCKLQTVFDEVIKCGGGNCYKLPHIGKDAIWKNYGVFVLRARAEQASQEACDMVRDVFGEF